MRRPFLRRLIQAIVILILIFYAFQKRETLAQIAWVFAAASVLTLVLSPACTLLERKGFRPASASAVCILGLVLLAALALSAFIPYLFASTADLIRRIIPTLFALTQRSRDILEAFNIRLNAQATPVEWLTALVSWGTGLVARSSVTFAAKAGQSVFALVIAYYLLCERRQIGRHLLLMLPVSWREAFLSACLGCKNALMSYLSGVLKTSLFVFVATLTGLFLLGINDALLLSVFMGILEVFPYIGPILASVPILLTALGQGFGQAVLALIVVIAVQQIEGNFVTPYFTASSTSIKPLSAFIGVFVLGSLMGLWGVVLAIPLIVVVRSVLWSIRSAVIMMKPS